MAASISDTNNSRRRGRPAVNATQIALRLPPADLAALDRWISERPEELTRPEAIRRILRANLPID
jgi:hypothetical protein